MIEELGKGRWESTVVVDVARILDAGGVEDGHGVLFPHRDACAVVAVAAACSSLAAAAAGILHLEGEQKERGRQEGDSAKEP